jgi:hypothetical protein
MGDPSMYDPQEELRKLLAGAGLYGQQIQQLQPKLQMGQQMMQPQMAQGAQVGGTYVASSPFEHLSNAIRQIVGAKMAGGAMQEQKDLTQGLGNARQQYMGALQTAQSGGQGAPEMLARPPDPQEAQRLGMMGVASGDPVMGQAAHFLQQSSQFAQQHGPQAALGGVSTDVHEAQTKRDALTRPEWEVNPMTGGFYNRRDSAPPEGGSGAASSMLTPEAKKQAATVFHLTGALPPAGQGQAGAAVRREIINMAAEMFPNDNRAGNKASYQADSASLASQQKILDNAEGWERTGKANLDVLLGIAKKLNDTGSPWLNRPVRYFVEKGIGDPNQTAFKAAHATVVNEYAKILSGAQGSSGVTDSARHEADSMLPLDATWEQLSAAAKVLDTDAGNRIGAARQQVSNIRGRIDGKPNAAPGQAGSGGGPRPRRTVNGETREWDGQKWVPIGQ